MPLPYPTNSKEVPYGYDMLTLRVRCREGGEKKWMKKVPSQAKGIGTFSFWGDFEAGIQSTGSLPDSPPAFRIGVHVSSGRLRHLFTLVYNIGKIHNFGTILCPPTEQNHLRCGKLVSR
jgi:hypothetical protein